MEREEAVLVSPPVGVPVVIDGEIVTAIRELRRRGWGRKPIARELGVSINTVRRYVRQPVVAGQQVRPTARRLSKAGCAEARALFIGPAEGNAVVVQRLLAEDGVRVSARTVQRAVADVRRAQRAADLATGRPTSLRFGWKRRRAISCRSILARSASRSATRGCGSFCWWRS